MRQVPTKKGCALTLILGLNLSYAVLGKKEAVSKRGSEWNKWRKRVKDAASNRTEKGGENMEGESGDVEVNRVEREPSY